MNVQNTEKNTNEQMRMKKHENKYMDHHGSMLVHGRALARPDPTKHGMTSEPRRNTDLRKRLQGSLA